MGLGTLGAITGANHTEEVLEPPQILRVRVRVRVSVRVRVMKMSIIFISRVRVRLGLEKKPQALVVKSQEAYRKHPHHCDGLIILHATRETRENHSNS